MKKNPLTMIRLIGTKITQNLVKFIIFLFKQFNFLFNLPFKFVKSFRSFITNSSYSLIKQSLFALVICAFGDLFAGVILSNMTFFLKAWPGLLTLIPGAIGMRGNIFGAFGSRLGTNLNLGILSPKFEKSKILNHNIISSIILTMILSVFLALITKFLCVVSGLPSIPLADFIIISFLAGMISSIIMLPISMLISLKSFQHGWDPDNITTPLIAAFGDFFTLPSIILSVMILSLFNDIVILRDVVGVLIVVFVIVCCYFGVKSSDDILGIVKQSAPILLVCSLLGSFAGGVLNNFADTLLSKGSLLTLVPLFSGESGNLVSILGARLSSSLHSGLIESSFSFDKYTLRNFTGIIVLAIIIYPLIGFLANFSHVVVGGVDVGFLSIILISLIAGVLLILIMQLIVYYISIVSYRKGLDPDNIVIPLSTSLTDSIATLILVLISIFVFSLAI